jgi:CheY-like chemotaxis protein/HPt (histidine-containing phosphotransfer) domain-containing protein
MHVQPLIDGRHVRGFQGVAHELGGARGPAVAVPPPATSDATESSAPFVLVVDDNDVNLKVTLAMLQNLGYRAEAAENGLEAVHACEHRAYDAVLMDCQMPQMDGFKATAFIREREGSRRHTPIIALTASVLPGERQKCLSAGMDDFLCKPVSLRQLDETLRRWTARAEPETGSYVLAADHPLRALEAQGLGALVAEVFGTFLDTTPTYVRQMHAAQAVGDASQVVGLAHSLKGAAVQVGAEEMAGICGRMQEAARTGDLQGLGALVVSLEATFEGLRRTLEPQRQRLLQEALPG